MRNYLGLFIPLFFLIACQTLVAQTTYYVASNGNDTNNGTSPSTPLLTINKVNSLVLQPGSKIFFRRNDTFQGSLTIKQSGTTANPITIGSYGTGAIPVISGSSAVINWNNLGNNIWQATCNQCINDVTGLYLNNSSLPLGRYPNIDAPNRGYLTVQSHSGKTVLTSKEPLTANWVGAEVVVRPINWILDRATITQQNNNTLIINNSSTYNIADNYGFFIQNHPLTLDKNGEWYFNPTNKTFQLYLETGNPNNQTITTTINSIGIDIRGMSNIVIQDLQITQTANYNLYAENVNSFSVINCQINNAGENGVFINGTGSNILFINSTINKCNNNGFQIDLYNNFVFRNNKLLDIATTPGRGKSGEAQYLGFIAYTLTNTTIDYNIIDSIGYNALTFPQNNATIYRNKISNFCLVKSDGGGLYNWNGVKNSMSNVILQENIIYNGIGAPEGSSDGFRGANGIYLDECISNVIIRNNTVFNCYGLGIYLHDTQNILSEGNTIFDCFEAQYSVDNTGICTAANNTSRNNIAVAKLPSQLTAKYESYTSSLTTLGSFDNNVYARPIDDVLTMRLSYPPPNGGLYDLQPLQEWQNKYGKDINSKKSPFTIKDYSISSFSGPETITEGSFNNNNGGFFVFSDFNNGQGNWDNTNKINGGSLALTFSSISGGLAASLYAAKTVGSVSKDKDYVVSFDAITTVPNRVILVYIQYQFPPFNRLVELYPGKIVSTSSQHYEATFRPTTNLENALLVFRVFESNQPLWIDNVSFRESLLNRLDPNSLTKIIYNPTTKDSTVYVNGYYRDVNNQLYPQTVTLGPYKSLILIKDALLPTTDLSLGLTPNKRLVQTNEAVTFTINVANTSSIAVATGQWELKVPPNLELINYNGLLYNNNTLTGNISNLSGNSQQLFQFTARPTSNGVYRLGAQIISSNIPDTDSNVNSGITDGEDDSAITEILTRNISNQFYESPNLNQSILPKPISSGNTISLTQADLSISIKVDKRVAKTSSILTYSVIIQNEGGYTANNIQIESIIPNGLQYIPSEGWSINGGTIRASINTLSANVSKVLIFQLRANQLGKYNNIIQITASSISDPDSTPNNGLRGEDDEASIDINIQQ